MYSFVKDKYFGFIKNLKRELRDFKKRTTRL